MSFIRYPGGKSKFRSQILNELLPHLNANVEYREPFFGGGSIGFEVLKKNCTKSFWINDKDIGMYCLWLSVRDYPNELKHLVKSFKPSIREFDLIREYFQNTLELTKDSIVEIGFKKLAIHQMSFSGLGLRSGGPLGGRKQDSNTKYPIDCRWSPNYICKNIDAYSMKMNRCDRFNITNNDFEDLINNQSNQAILYLDPPYYEKGGDLYVHAFDHTDHVRLAEALRRTSHFWVLSYDDCTQVKALYDWAFVGSFDGKYSIKQTEGAINKKTELLIMPHDMREIAAKISSELINLGGYRLGSDV